MTQQSNHNQEVLDIIFQWDKVLRILERNFNQNYNLTLNQCRLLLYISHKNYIELSHIHDWLHIDKSTTTRMIRPLVVEGYLDKFYQFGDKRKLYIRIAENGQERVKSIEHEFKQLAQSMLHKIPAGKRDLTIHFTRVLLDTI